MAGSFDFISDALIVRQLTVARKRYIMGLQMNQHVYFALKAGLKPRERG